MHPKIQDWGKLLTSRPFNCKLFGLPDVIGDGSAASTTSLQVLNNKDKVTGTLFQYMSGRVEHVTCTYIPSMMTCKQREIAIILIRKMSICHLTRFSRQFDDSNDDKHNSTHNPYHNACYCTRSESCDKDKHIPSHV